MPKLIERLMERLYPGGIIPRRGDYMAEEPVILEWRKDCDCKASSTTGAFRLYPQYLMQCVEGRWVLRTKFIPGPSCDACGKPWRRVR